MSQEEGNPPEDSAPQPNLAIEYAPNPTPPRQPRQPSNLQDLLRYAVEAGSRAEGSEPHPVRPNPISQANSGFVLNALHSMMVNVGEELTNIVKTLKENSNDVCLCIEALDNLSDYVCTIDYANDFLKMGGLSVLKLLLEGNEPELRWRAAETIADIVQNNEFSQNFIIRTDMFTLLLDSIEHDTNTTVRIKCLYAVSCLVRENQKCLQKFFDRDGFSILLRCIQSNQEKLVIKSCFLISSLCVDNADVKQILFSMGIVEQIAILIDIDSDGHEKEFNSEKNEHLLSALTSLLEDSPEAQALCRQEPLNLKFKLNYIREKHEGNEVYEQELYYVGLVYRTVFGEESTEEPDYQDR